MLQLAHLSDPHLGPLPAAGFRALMSKRLTGYLSWKLRRRKIHQGQVLDALVNDIKRIGVQRIAVTGDLVNIALQSEFPRARAWLETLGTPADIALVPGNHDAYVRVNWEEGQGLWQPYMSGDAAVSGRPKGNQFPYIRLYRNVALIGASTAVETYPFQASGELGSVQLEVLDKNLERLRQQGFFRVLMIHHPPLPGQAITRKALNDADQLRDILKTQGAELILHGHNHTQMHEILESRHGPVHIFGVPSASAVASAEKPAAAWNLYSIDRKAGKWSCNVKIRGLQENQTTFRDLKDFDLYA